MEENKFIENDVSGETTLEVIAEADKFNDWMFQTIKPHLKGHVLEIGSGIGNLSKQLVASGFDATLSDIRDGYCQTLSNTFKDEERIKGVVKMDLVDPDFDEKFKDYFNCFDSIFALNVVEHINDDVQALANCKKLLKTEGNLVILVPSYQWLFNQFDVELGHYRRYTIAKLKNVFNQAKVEVLHQQYFNMFGMVGWFVSGRILQKKTIPKGQMRIYNMLVPIFKLIDKVLLNSVGLSTIVIGTKKSD